MTNVTNSLGACFAHFPDVTGLDQPSIDDHCAAHCSWSAMSTRATEQSISDELRPEFLLHAQFCQYSLLWLEQIELNEHDNNWLANCPDDHRKRKEHRSYWFVMSDGLLVCSKYISQVPASKIFLRRAWMFCIAEVCLCSKHVHVLSSCV